APRFLLSARRSRPAHLAGRWEFPGGRVDPGETPTQALHRELREELGVTVELGDELVGPDHGTRIITDRHGMLLWFGRITAGEPRRVVEYDEPAWLGAGSGRDGHWRDADGRIVAEPARQVAAEAV